MSILTLPLRVARRYVMGRQGLWPGRRYAGRRGAADALRAAEMVQLDPLDVVGRSHDLALLSRVHGLARDDLDALCFQERRFFDYGDTLFLCPMEELPIWRVVMARRAAAPRWSRFAAEHAAVIAHVRDALERRGPLGNRDFTGRPAVESYRASKDTGLALFYLWLTGAVMTHHRRRWERVFAFSEAIAPPALLDTADVDAAESALVRKQVAFHGLCPRRPLFGLLARPVEPQEADRWLTELVRNRELLPVDVEGARETHYMLAEDEPLVRALLADDLPAAWAPVHGATNDEVTLLAPLEIVTARRRAQALFGFDYVWEVYKPAAQRRWGYYTLPILWGDALVARADLKHERGAGALAVKGFWLEEQAGANAERGANAEPGDAFAAALGRGLGRLANYLGAETIEDGAAIAPEPLRRRALETAAAVIEGETL
jgi:hypothetical protein